jgi:hypothetical protein
VLSYTHKGDLKSRRQTGIKVFGDELPPELLGAFEREFKLGIPKAHIGKSVFHLGDRLVRVVCRTGCGFVDVDLQRAYTHLRLLHARPHLELPLMRAYMEDPVAATAALAAKHKVEPKAMKTLITAAGNQQRLDPRQFADKDVYIWLLGFQKENEAIIDDEIEQRPLLFKEVDEACSFNSKLSFMSRVDQDREAEVVNRFDTLKVPAFCVLGSGGVKHRFCP